MCFSKVDKLMWPFLDKSLTYGIYGHKLHVAKKLNNSYIIAIRAINQKRLELYEVKDEWAVFLAYHRRKGRDFPQNSKEFTACRSAFFNAITRCRCVPDGKFEGLKKVDFVRYNFHPLKDYKYFVFTCARKNMPQWLINITTHSDHGHEDGYQDDPPSPDLLEAAMDIADVPNEVENQDEYLDQPSENKIQDHDEQVQYDCAGINLQDIKKELDNVSQTLTVDVTTLNQHIRFDLLKDLYKQLEDMDVNNPECNNIENAIQLLLFNNSFETTGGNFNEVSTLGGQIICAPEMPVSHAVQDTPGANAVALFTSQQTEVGQILLNPTDMTLDSPYFPERDHCKMLDAPSTFLLSDQIIDDPMRRVSMVDDLTDTPPSTPLDVNGGNSLVCDNPMDCIRSCDVPETSFDPDSVLNKEENVIWKDFDVFEGLNDQNDPDLALRDFNILEWENFTMDIPRGE